jgi:hypothetical protein
MMDKEELLEAYKEQGIQSKEDVIFAMLLFLIDRELSKHSMEYDVERSIEQYRIAYDGLPYSHEL